MVWYRVVGVCAFNTVFSGCSLGVNGFCASVNEQFTLLIMLHCWIVTGFL